MINSPEQRILSESDEHTRNVSRAKPQTAASSDSNLWPDMSLFHQTLLTNPSHAILNMESNTTNQHLYYVMWKWFNFWFKEVICDMMLLMGRWCSGWWTTEDRSTWITFWIIEIKTVILCEGFQTALMVTKCMPAVPSWKNCAICSKKWSEELCIFLIS